LIFGKYVHGQHGEMAEAVAFAKIGGQAAVDQALGSADLAVIGGYFVRVPPYQPDRPITEGGIDFLTNDRHPFNSKRCGRKPGTFQGHEKAHFVALDTSVELGH